MYGNRIIDDAHNKNRTVRDPLPFIISAGKQFFGKKVKTPPVKRLNAVGARRITKGVPVELALR